MTTSNLRSVDRRDFLRRAGLVAGAAPVIVTVIASKAQASPSCTPNGTICGGNVLAGCSNANPPCCTTCSEKPATNDCTCGGV